MLLLLTFKDDGFSNASQLITPGPDVASTDKDLWVLELLIEKCLFSEVILNGVSSHTFKCIIMHITDNSFFFKLV